MIYKSFLDTLVLNERTLKQQQSLYRDDFGNPIDSNKLIIKGFRVWGSSVERGEAYCEAFNAFNNNPQSWKPSENEISENNKCELYIDLSFPVFNAIGKRYVDNKKENVDVLRVKFNNTNNKVTKILFYASEDRENYDKLLEYSCNNIIIDKDLSIHYENQELRKKYINFKIVFITNPYVKTDDVNIEKIDLLNIVSMDNSQGIVPYHTHSWFDITDKPTEKPNNQDTNYSNKYILKPVYKEKDLPIDVNINEGTLCLVISESRIYYFSDGRWIPIISEKLDNNISKRILLRRGTLDKNHTVFDTVDNQISRDRLLIIDEDGIQWNGENDYELVGTNIFFNYILPYPVEINIYKLTQGEIPRTDMVLLTNGDNVYSIKIDNKGYLYSEFYSKYSELNDPSIVDPYFTLRNSKGVEFTLAPDKEGSLYTVLTRRSKYDKDTKDEKEIKIINNINDLEKYN